MRPNIRRFFPSVALFVLLANCGGGDSAAPATPKSLAKQAGDNQSATVGAAVAIAPAVKITDANSAPMAGIAVTFAVTSGNGALSGALTSTVNTGSDGVATAANWTLGTNAGTNTLTATISATGVTGNPATFTATGVAGAPKTLTKQAGDNATGAAGVAVTTAPSVKLVDQFNNPVSGASVTFAVASGGGSLTGATPVTDASGIATVGSWTLGTTPGANTLSVTTAASGVTGSPATFTATSTAGAAKTLTKQAGDNATASAGAAVTTPPSVKVVDQFNNPVSGVTVTFAVASGGGAVTAATPATNASGIATVGSWTLGASAGVNTLTATAAGTGITGNPATFTATGTAPAFNPTSNTTIGGINTFGSVNIPAGVTVTMTSDLTLTATGVITIAGSLVGDCKAVSVTANGALNVTGTINNECAVQPDTAPTITLVGKGGYHFTGGGTVRSMGDVLVTNDLTYTPALTSMQSGISAPVVRRVASGRASLIDYDCESNVFVWPVPPPARNGLDGTPTGKDGIDGKKWTLSCHGNGLINQTSVTGARGGNGGKGTHTSATAAESRGGKGGKGGELRVRVSGQLDFGAGNTITSGAGGNGGDATATSTTNATPGVAPPATATGGAGGAPGLISIAAEGGISIAGGLTLNVGRGGNGGDATAVAADGVDATAAKVAQIGGTATATGGVGGSSPNRQLQAGGGITGTASVTLTGGDGGNGGIADANAGKGGDGVRENPNGALGGDAIANGGLGGDSQVRNLANGLVSNGGNGNDAFMRRAFGGNGYNDCVAPLIAGGKGGNGGIASGGRGLGGLGLANGNPGTTRETIVSNGGDGGHGLGPGLGGNAGADLAVGAKVVTQRSFQAGVRGRGCRFTVALSVLSDPAPSHEPFVLYVSGVTILDAFVDNVTNAITFTGIANGKWITVTGTFDPLTGTFNTVGAGTAAGIPNVPVTFVGVINKANGTISGQVTLFGNASTPPNGLPGHSVVYGLTGNVIGASPP